MNDPPEVHAEHPLPAVVVLPGATASTRTGIVHEHGDFAETVESSVSERFMNEQHLDIWHTVDHVDQVLPAIEAVEPWPENAVEFATR